MKSKWAGRGREREEVEPADTSALDSNCDLAIFEIFGFLDRLEAWFRFSYPELVGRVGVDADVGLGDCACGRHYEV